MPAASLSGLPAETDPMVLESQMEIAIRQPRHVTRVSCHRGPRANALGCSRYLRAVPDLLECPLRHLQVSVRVAVHHVNYGAVTRAANPSRPGTESEQETGVVGPVAATPSVAR